MGIPVDFIIDDLKQGEKYIIEATYEVTKYHYERDVRVIDEAKLLYYSVVPVCVRQENNE